MEEIIVHYIKKIGHQKTPLSQWLSKLQNQILQCIYNCYFQDIQDWIKNFYKSLLSYSAGESIS